MGCSESAAVMQKPIQQQKEQIKEPAIKPKAQDPSHYLLGHIAESEYLFARVNLSNRSIDRLSIPQGFEPRNFSSMLDLGHKQYFISGGMNFSFNDITDSCFIYNSNTHTVRKVANMNQARYTHASLLYNEQLYIFGGRYFGEDNVAILSHCEVYNFKQDIWSLLPRLNVKRCTCYTMAWNNQVYVFGGYTGQYERSELIERLNTKYCKWEILPFALNRGIESGYVQSYCDNTVTIFGGNTNTGPTASVISINFETRSVKSHRLLSQEKMLHKSFEMQGETYIFGGSAKGNLQIYSLVSNKSQTVNIKLYQQFIPDIFQGLTHSQKSLVVSYRKEVPRYIECTQNDDVILTFGTTDQPFIFQLNVSIPSSQVLPVPLSLKLSAQAGGVHLQGLQYLLFGGIDDSLTTVTAETYLYNHHNNTAQKLEDMITPRYSFSFQKIESRVYALGGGTNEADGHLIILSSCQYFDIQTKKWQSVCSLPIPLLSSTALNYNKNLYLFGGLTTNEKRNKSIYKYEQSNDKWVELGFHLPFGIEAGSIYQFRANEFYIFGGRIDNGDTDKIFSLIFTNQEGAQCAFIEKGKMSERKNGVKVFKPNNQDFIVCLGGEKHLVSYYALEDLEPMEWDGLRKLKEVFSTQIKNFSSTTMKRYLTIAH